MNLRGWRLVAGPLVGAAAGYGVHKWITCRGGG
jgi:hypothetical protein